MKEKLLEDTSAAAYWGGYLAADGSISRSGSGRCYELRLSSSEEEPIDKFCAWLGINKRHVVTRDRDNPDKNYAKRILGGKNYYYAGIGVTNIMEDLSRLYGIVPKKSGIYAPGVCQTSHFWRGFIDGDGWISHKPESATPRVVGIAGTYAMCEAWLRFINKCVGYEKTLTISKKKGRDNFYSVDLSAKEDFSAVCAALYADSTEQTRLSRKFNNACKALESIDSGRFLSP